MQSIQRQQHFDGLRVVLGSPSNPRLRSPTLIAKKTEENGSQSRKSDYLVKIGPWTSERLLG